MHSRQTGLHHPLHEADDELPVGEGHLDVELRDLLDAICAKVFVAEADGDLVIAVEAGDDQQLLEDLRRLRQARRSGRAASGSGTTKSRAPSGVGLKRIGVWMSRKPASSMTRRMIDTICARSPMFRWSLSRRRSSQRYRSRSVSSTPSSSSWNGSGGAVDTMSSVSTRSSTSPVARFGFTSSGARATTSPSARSTNSLRTPCAASAAAGACSGLTTSWQRPARSRRSMKTRPPWSRRRWAQPASVMRRPTCSGRGSPHIMSRHVMGEGLRRQPRDPYRRRRRPPLVRRVGWPASADPCASDPRSPCRRRARRGAAPSSPRA